MYKFFWFAFFALVVVVAQCSKHRNPVVPPPKDGTECDTVICEVENITVKFTVVKDQSAPNVYRISRAGFPDEEIRTGSAPVATDTSFSRTFLNYEGELYGIRKISGSKAEALSVEVVNRECAENIVPGLVSWLF